jgi:hypothetical protein
VANAAETTPCLEWAGGLGGERRGDYGAAGVLEVCDVCMLQMCRVPLDWIGLLQNVVVFHWKRVVNFAP